MIWSSGQHFKLFSDQISLIKLEELKLLVIIVRNEFEHDFMSHFFLPQKNFQIKSKDSYKISIRFKYKITVRQAAQRQFGLGLYMTKKPYLFDPLRRKHLEALSRSH